ncbi:MAG: hypothetical protein HQ594_00330 [Candidatus Omnitrophica bacterium]|nr:hypothetical protein [Candidatus Omnitrophota bacterium]
MNTCPLLELCKCGDTGICIFCMILTVICAAAIGAIIGYFIGRKKRGKKD